MSDGVSSNVEARSGDAVGVTERKAGVLGKIGWVLYDAGGSPYQTLINVFLFSAYFTTTVIGDPVRGAAIWNYVAAAAALLLIAGGPIAGAIADAGGRRKPWLAACTLLGAPCMAGLWFATPHMTTGLPWVIVCLIGAFVAFEYSQIFCSALLPGVAPKTKIGLYSGLGYSVGNITAVALLLFYLAAWQWSSTPLFGLAAAAHEPQRAVGPMVGLVFLLYAIPLFLFTPDAPGAGLSIPQAARKGVKQLLTTLSKIGHYRNVAVYLLARLIFNEGFVAVMMLTGIFAGAVLHWRPEMLVMQGLINSVVAGFAALIAGWMADRFGSKLTTLVFLVGVVLVNLVLFTLTPTSVLFFIPLEPSHGGGMFASLSDKIFLANSTLGAVCVIGGYVSTRALMVRLTPPAMLNEFFGLFYLSGRAASFMGPLITGVVIQSFHSIRAGVVVGLVFTIVGLLIMFFVHEPRDETALPAGAGRD
ncbi:MAG: MFS transporter [Caulobacteraceae bacterium]